MSDSLNGVLVELVKGLGGSKQVGPLLWPERGPEDAQRRLLDCLNDDRPTHLKPEQVLFILRMARQRGLHTGFAYLAETLGYAPPVPIEPRDEVAELQRQFVQAMSAMTELAERMERLTPHAAKPHLARAA